MSADIILALLRLTNWSSAKTTAAAAEEDPFAAFTETEVAVAKEWAAEEKSLAAAAGVGLVTVSDSAYPARLKSLSSPPPLLFYRGDVKALGAQKAAAIVGTRNPSRFGASASRTLAASLAGRGFVVVSGLAKGVDSEAHLGCLDGGGATVAILGNGLGSIYPAENRALAERIVEEGGVLLSERPMAARVEPRYLIARNRLQSGMSALVVVVETGIKGGTPHTARFALEQNRPIFCPEPHNPKAASAEGITVLLTESAASLPSRLQAFSGAKRLCAARGQSPIAKPLTREGLDEFLAEAEAIAGA